MIVAGFRRFAGQASPTSTLQIPVEFVSGALNRGARLGTSSAEAQAQGAAAQAQNPQLFKPQTSPLAGQDIASLRKQLGIDDLITSIKGLSGSAGGGYQMPQFEMPQFEMPQFEMPEEQPGFDFESALGELTSKFEDYYSQLAGKAEGGETTPTAAPTRAKASTKKTVGGLTYNIGKTLGLKDISGLKAKGASKSVIAQFASGTTGIKPSARKELRQMGFAVKPGETGGFTVAKASKSTGTAAGKSTAAKASAAKSVSQTYQARAAAAPSSSGAGRSSGSSSGAGRSSGSSSSSGAGRSSGSSSGAGRSSGSSGSSGAGRSSGSSGGKSKK